MPAAQKPGVPTAPIMTPFLGMSPIIFILSGTQPSVACPWLPLSFNGSNLLLCEGEMVRELHSCRRENSANMLSQLAFEL